MNKLFQVIGGAVGIVILFGASYLITGWKDPYFRPMDLLKTKKEPQRVRITYPDSITIEPGFAETLLTHKTSQAIARKKRQFISHLNDVGSYIVTPTDPSVFRAITVANEEKVVLSFTVYMNVLIDTKNSEVAYRMSGLIEQFPNGPNIVERVEKNTKTKVFVEIDKFHGLRPSLWDLAVYAALEFGPCCR